MKDLAKKIRNLLPQHRDKDIYGLTELMLVSLTHAVVVRDLKAPVARQTQPFTEVAVQPDIEVITVVPSPPHRVMDGRKVITKHRLVRMVIGKRMTYAGATMVVLEFDLLPDHAIQRP